MYLYKRFNCVFTSEVKLFRLTCAYYSSFTRITCVVVVSLFWTKPLPGAYGHQKRGKNNSNKRWVFQTLRWLGGNRGGIMWQMDAWWRCSFIELGLLLGLKHLSAGMTYFSHDFCDRLALYPLWIHAIWACYQWCCTCCEECVTIVCKYVWRSTRIGCLSLLFATL